MEKIARNEQGAAQRAVGRLRPYPASIRVYRDHASPALISSVRTMGVLEPLLVTTDSQILDGRKRWEAACELGLEYVPVRVFTSADEDDRLEALIVANHTRTKTNEQRGREVLALGDMAKKRDTSARGGHGDWVGRRVGLGATSVERLRGVMAGIAALEAGGKDAEANELRAFLNRTTINTAYEYARERGWIRAKGRGRPITNPGRASERQRQRERRAEKEGRYHRGSLLGRSPEYMRGSAYVQSRMHDMIRMVRDIADEHGFDEMVRAWTPATRLSAHRAIAEFIAVLERYDGIVTMDRGRKVRAPGERQNTSQENTAIKALAEAHAARLNVPRDDSTMEGD